jgi:hypothetical protein
MATPHGHSYSNSHGREPDRSRVERDAITVAVRLLGDQTLHVMQAAREQLHLFGESARPALQVAARDGDVPTCFARARCCASSTSQTICGSSRL